MIHHLKELNEQTTPVMNTGRVETFHRFLDTRITVILSRSSKKPNQLVLTVDIASIEIGKGGQRPVNSVYMSRYAYYLVIQNADPTKEIVAIGQTYFAVQTRRQELSDNQFEDNRRLMLREEMKKHNISLAGAAKEAVWQRHPTMPFSKITDI